MTTYVFRNGKVVEKNRETAPSATNVISDVMEPTRHMVTGRYFTSKSAFRAETKAAGCIEVGNELPTLTKPRTPVPMSREKRREDIRRTIYELRNGIKG